MEFMVKCNFYVIEQWHIAILPYQWRIERRKKKSENKLCICNSFTHIYIKWCIKFHLHDTYVISIWQQSSIRIAIQYISTKQKLFKSYQIVFVGVWCAVLCCVKEISFCRCLLWWCSQSWFLEFVCIFYCRLLTSKSNVKCVK